MWLPREKVLFFQSPPTFLCGHSECFQLKISELFRKALVLSLSPLFRQPIISLCPFIYKARNICLSVCKYVCMSFAYLKNCLSNLLHNRQVHCWGYKGVQCQNLVQFGQANHQSLSSAPAGGASGLCYCMSWSELYNPPMRESRRRHLSSFDNVNVRLCCGILTHLKKGEKKRERGRTN